LALLKKKEGRKPKSVAKCMVCGDFSPSDVSRCQSCGRSLEAPEIEFHVGEGPKARVEPAATSFPGEALIGVIHAVSLGSRAYDLVVTNYRIIGADVGWSGGGSTLEGALVGAAFSSGEGTKRAGYAGMSFDQLLLTNKRNFWIPGEQILSAILDGGSSGWTVPALQIVAHGKRYDFTFEKQNWSRNEQVMHEAKVVLWNALGPRVKFIKV
jgi:hypothetical protein